MQRTGNYNQYGKKEGQSMRGFLELLKTNIKLLLRNKGFLFFLFITPIVSVIIMNLHVESSFYAKKETRKITELSGKNEKVVYLNDWGNYAIKVYDAAGTELSEYVLQKIEDAGMFSVYRQNAKGMTEEEILKQVKDDAKNDRMGTVLYLKSTFDKEVMNGNLEKAFLFYQVSEDERWELLENVFCEEITAIQQVAQGTNGEEKQVLSTLEEIEKNMPQKEIVSLEGKNQVSLSVEQNTKKNLTGYAYAILTLGFVFCGVCIAYTVIEERENKVYTRIRLSKVGRYEYLVSKFFMSVLISLLQTGVMSVYMFVWKEMDFGIPKLSFLLFVFLVGLIFNVLSLTVGILIGDIMGANYAVFAVWVVSSLLSGLYFPIEGSSEIIKHIAHLMPQRWFLKGTEMLMTGDNSAYSMIGFITLAYLIIILCIGAVGLRMKESEA